MFFQTVLLDWPWPINPTLIKFFYVFYSTFKLNTIFTFLFLLLILIQLSFPVHILNFFPILLLSLKVVFATFSLVCFLCLKESTWETRKNVFISLQKLFLFSGKSNFRILDIQISWCHQMSKYETRNTFYWITWEVNTIC